jgi:amidase
MNRRFFLAHTSLWATAATVWGNELFSSPRMLLAKASPAPGDTPRRLSSKKSFTLYHAGLEPAYWVRLGEIVLVECQHGLPGLVTRDGKFREAGKNDMVNPHTGPIFVEGIAPGDTLALDILDITVDEWGYCQNRIIELRDQKAIINDHLQLPLQPMLGGVGIVPAQGTMDTKTPKDTGGNMDCREVRAGSTLLFTAQVPGALLGFGDAHALQGDGEISGQGIETSAEVVVRFRKLPKAYSPRPVILRPELIATLSANADLAEAAWQATDDMVSLLVRHTGRDEKEARLLVNLLGQLKISQIVDAAKGARMEMPLWVLGLQ